MKNRVAFITDVKDLNLYDLSMTPLHTQHPQSTTILSHENFQNHKICIVEFSSTAGLHNGCTKVMSYLDVSSVNRKI